MEQIIKQKLKQAITKHLEGKLDEAELLYQDILKIKPEHLDANNNLGLILKHHGRLDEAQIYYKKAIELKPNYAEAHNNLGNLQFELENLDEAEASYKKATELKPEYAEAHNNLGIIQFKFENFVEAEASYKKAIEHKPDLTEAYENFANLAVKLDRPDEAKASLRKVVELKPDHVVAKHLLSALTGKITNSAPREYVENLFNNIASNFEDSLVRKLDYKTPKIITEMIVAKKPDTSLGSILDLGCGTGLIGDEIKKFCTRLDGIDLSKSMLKIAKAKNVYDKLQHQDIIEYLSTEDLNFDYFISADVFVYVGDLRDIFRLIKSRNKSGGKFVFSTEHTDRDGFFLEQTGRYSHSKKYIESLCVKFGYKLSHFEKKQLRKEKNNFIIGGLYLLDF